MFRLSLSILPILLSGCLSTCHNGIAENVPQHSDSSLYLNNTIQVGDTAMRLVERGIMTPDIENKNLYNLVDNTFLGINFNRSIVSTYNGLVNGLFLFSRNFDKESEYQSVMNKIFKNIGNTYKQAKDTTYNVPGAQFDAYVHEYEWLSESKKMSVFFNKRSIDGFATLYDIQLYIIPQDSVIKNRHLTHLYPDNN